MAMVIELEPVGTGAAGTITLPSRTLAIRPERGGRCERHRGLDRGGPSRRHMLSGRHRRAVLRAHPRSGRSGRSSSRCATKPTRSRTRKHLPPNRTPDRAALWRAGRREGQHRRQGTADHRRLPGVRVPAVRRCHLRCPSQARRRDRHRQDQPGSVRHRSRRRTLTLRRAAQPVRSGAHSRRLEQRIGHRGRRRPCSARARNRHRRLGPRTRRYQQYRRVEAEPRPWSRPQASCLPAARSTASRYSRSRWTMPSRPLPRWPVPIRRMPIR